MKITNLLIVTLAASFAAATGAFAQTVTLPPASDKTGVTYATDIKPIFDASCVKCHSGDKAKARLHLDTLEGVLKGTKQGKIVTPGDPEKSWLVKSVAHLTKDPEGWMPPLRNKAGIKPLTKDEIALIIGWVKQGAK
jgi:mono/diheme cytochrome c family protein